MKAESIPRKAVEAANLVFDSMMKVDYGESAAKEKTEVLRCGAKTIEEVRQCRCRMGPSVTS